MAILATSCSSQPLRAVVDVVPESVSYELQVRATDRHLDASIEGADFGAEPELIEPAGPGVTLASPTSRAFESKFIGIQHRGRIAPLLPRAGARQVIQDLNQGPVDLGFPLLVDFGAGVAPYDDGIPTIHGVELTRSGFSDSVLQASWGQPWTATSIVHGTVAVSRYQDLGIMDGMSDMRFAWFVVGWKTAL